MAASAMRASLRSKNSAYEQTIPAGIPARIRGVSLICFRMCVGLGQRVKLIQIKLYCRTPLLQIKFVGLGDDFKKE